jgi:serine phosphatase RsbU (regulator of sigma subunit)
LDRGDILFVYSDGLGEGHARGLEDLLERVDLGVGASSIVEQLIERSTREETSDDVTLLVLKCVD